MANLSSPRSIPQELQAIIPTVKVPLVPIIIDTETPSAMFADFALYPWVLDLHRYRGLTDLVASFDEALIARAESKGQELTRAKSLS